MEDPCCGLLCGRIVNSLTINNQKERAEQVTVLAKIVKLIRKATPTRIKCVSGIKLLGILPEHVHCTDSLLV